MPNVTMKVRPSVLIAISLSMCGSAIAAPIERVNFPLTRLDPAFVTPEYFVDGVWVEGPALPYSRWQNRDMPNRRVVWDGAFAVDGGNNDWIPGQDPCSGSGYLFASTTDTTVPDRFNVQAGNMVNDFSGLDPLVTVEPLYGFMWKWHQFGSEPALRFRLRWYDRCNTSNSTTFTGTGFFVPPIPTVAGAGRYGVTLTYELSGPGDYYSSYDESSNMLLPILQPLPDTDGAFQILAESGMNVSARTVNFYLQAPQGTPDRPGTSNDLLWVDDSGELGRISANHPYSLEAAIPDRAIQITGAAADGNESYVVSGAPCFTSGLGPSSSWWTRRCSLLGPARLLAPINGSTGLLNPVSLSFEIPPGETVASCQAHILLNNYVMHITFSTSTSTITIDENLDAGRCYGWRIHSNPVSCGGRDSDIWTFRMAGCAADFNADGVIDFFDYLDFVDDFASKVYLADFNADQVIDFFDYLDFVDALSQGC